MRRNRYYSEVERHGTLRRPVPKCYSRPGISKAVSEPQIDWGNNAILIALSIITCIAALVVVCGGWRF
jgi:hypothetical protein